MWHEVAELPASPQQAEGDAAHYVAECMLRTAQGMPGDTYESILSCALSVGEALLGVPDPKGSVITRDMVDGASVYLEDVLAVYESLRAQVGDYVVLGVEQVEPLVLGRVTIGIRIDAYVRAPTIGKLYLFDFKFGHRYVSAVNNPTLILYAVALLARFAPPGTYDDSRLRVEQRIVAPRCYQSPTGPINAWAYTASDLRAWVNFLTSRADATLDPGAQCVSGSHCTGCPARLGCAEAGKAAFAAFEYAGAPVPDELDNTQLTREARILRLAADAVKARLSAIDLQMEACISRGESLPGFKVTHGVGPRRWKEGIDVAGFGAAYGVDLIDRGVVSPAEAARRLKTAGVPKPDEVLETLVEKPSTGARITVDDGTDAIRAFGGRT